MSRKLNMSKIGLRRSKRVSDDIIRIVEEGKDRHQTSGIRHQERSQRGMGGRLPKGSSLVRRKREVVDASCGAVGGAKTRRPRASGSR